MAVYLEVALQGKKVMMGWTLDFDIFLPDAGFSYLVFWHSRSRPSRKARSARDLKYERRWSNVPSYRFQWYVLFGRRGIYVLEALKPPTATSHPVNR